MTAQQEVELILADRTKRIKGDIRWADDEYHSPARVFRVSVLSGEEYPLRIAGRWNPRAGKLSYVLLYRGLGRIYALDMGTRHRNPTGEHVGETHKHSWTDQYQDKLAYIPRDITAPWDQPVEVWQQFCAEARIIHDGTLARPHWQGELNL